MERAREIRKREESYRTISDVAPLGIWASDAERRVKFWNRWWFEYTGLTPDDTLGQDWLAAVHPDYRQRAADECERAHAEDTAFEIETLLRRFDGEYRWHLIRGRPVERAPADAPEWIGIVLDVHDQRKAEEEALSSEKQLRELADSIPQLAWIADARGTAFWFNQRWQEYNT